MEEDKKYYQFVNGQTGNVIAYLSVAISISPDAMNEILDQRRKELATEHGIYFETIYWEADKTK